VYHITVTQSPDSFTESQMMLDGIAHYDKAIPLVNDLREHFVELTFVLEKVAA
jgi:hypothetical protein